MLQKLKCLLGLHDWRFKAVIPDWASLCFPGKKCAACGYGFYRVAIDDDNYPDWREKYLAYEEPPQKGEN